MEKQKLIYVESKALFSPSEVSDKAIVFIEDTKEIWTHGVYFSCSGAWASPITLSLTGDTTGSVSIDGSGNASIATTTNYLSGTTVADANNAANTQSQKIAYYARIGRDASNLFPASNNANGILSLNVHDYSYTHLLGFSSNGNIYHRRRNGGTWETSWKTILSSSNYTNFPHTFASLTNKPTTLSGYGITDCIPIISGGIVTTDTDLSTLGMTTYGAKLSVSYANTQCPWMPPYSNFLMFRSTVDTYSGISTGYQYGHVTFIGGRIDETIVSNAPNWWFGIKGNSGTTYDLNSFLNVINNLDGNYLRKSGGTMTGTLTLKGGVYTDAANTGALNANNSNIYGLNSLYFADASETAAEGINFYRSSTTVDSLWGSNGNLFWTPNRTYGLAGTSYYVLTSNNYSTHLNKTYLPLSGGTMTGNIILTTGKWIADSTTSTSILGTFASGNSTEGLYSEAGVLVGNTATLTTLSSNGDDLWHYRNSDKKRYKILDANNYNTYALPLTGGTLTGNITVPSAFINTGDATLKFYSGKITDAKSDGNICLQTSIDGTDGLSHVYPTQLGGRCNLVLLPRGGQVYIGTNPDGGNIFYKLYVNGGIYASSLNTGGTASQFLKADGSLDNNAYLPLSGGTMTGAISSMNITPKASNTYTLGSTSYYYKGAYSYGFYKNGSSNSYVLLGGGGHKAVSDFPIKELKKTTSISGNTDQWSIILEQSYPAGYWYDVINTFLVEGVLFGSGFLSFYAYWNASSSSFLDYITEVYFNGVMRNETTNAFGGSNRDINDYLRIYIDKTNYKLLVYANHYNGKTVRIKRINYNEIETSGFPNGGILVEHFNDKGTIVSLPTESTTMTRVLIKTHYNHDRTIKTSKSVYASSFYESSDIRLKENVGSIDLSDLMKNVDLVLFNFKDNLTKKYGVIAQLLEAAGLNNLVYDNDGNKAVDYISLLVLEMQRLRNEIADLREKLNNKEQTS